MKHEKKCRQNIVTAVCITLLAAGLTGTVLGLLLATAIGAAAGEPSDAQPGGAFTCDFGLSSDPSLLPPDQIAPSIERDRMYMAARPGMLHKHIPISFDANHNVFSGGRYLFDTAEHAREYRDWVFNTYVLDGVNFLKRSYFLNPDCHAWTVIGAHDFGDVHSSQIVLRTERWSLRNARQPGSGAGAEIRRHYGRGAGARPDQCVVALRPGGGARLPRLFRGKGRPKRSQHAGLGQPERPRRRSSARPDIRRPGLEADLRPYPMGSRRYGSHLP